MQGKIWHVSVQGNGGQSMFLTNSDILHATNLLGVLSDHFKVEVWAYDFMSNHFHFIVQCDEPQYFMQAYRLSYTRYYNSVHNTSGSVGRRGYRAGLLNNPEKIVEKLIYVIRNSVRHKLHSHPYADPYNSARYYFAEEQCVKWQYCKPAGSNLYLSHSHRTIPEYFLIDKKGQIFPRSFLKYRKVEKCFKSYAQFMSMISNPTEKELAEEKDRKLHDKRKYVKNVSANVSDLQLSEMIISYIKPRSIASLSDSEIVSIAKYCLQKYPVSLRQLSRIFGIPESTLRWRLKR